MKKIIPILFILAIIIASAAGYQFLSALVKIHLVTKGSQT